VSKQVKFTCPDATTFVQVEVIWNPGDPYGSLYVNGDLYDGLGIPVTRGHEAEECLAAFELVTAALQAYGMNGFYGALPDFWTE